MMQNKISRMIRIMLVLFLILDPGVLAQEKTNFEEAIIYYNEACSMCSSYLRSELIPLLEELGVKKIIKKDYVNEKQNRIELNELNKQYNIPPSLQGHFMIFIDNRLILGGHVPKQIVTDLLRTDYKYDRLLVLQDEMSDARSYFAWGFLGGAKEYEIDTPISSYITWFNNNKESLKRPEMTYGTSWSLGSMLPLIIMTGFLDGINPCAIAVLLFFITFLYTIHKTKASIWKMGITYIFSIFLAYFLIGIGLMKAFIISGAPHLMARIGAYLIIGLGILNLMKLIMPSIRLNLGIPSFTKGYIKRWMYKATIPATFILGFLVGLCTFPCSGGMYVAVVGLLATKATYLQGIIYLVIYNLMFILPLFIILLVAGNKTMTEKITEMERSQNRMIKLASGLIMILLGLTILIWFV